eukprot:Unigene11328_Nuclearia_a/m.34607 Unigene11328_Nuclearia_a/g.34607  ORF Unigene11328_Nuclearia_a/g.34607 Unigene11328_Nuclearia_a/m.34607 type:complete len:250 (+) Unigene11328_Nuclearia_a:24-773(+)
MRWSDEPFAIMPADVPAAPPPPAAPSGEPAAEAKPLPGRPPRLLAQGSPVPLSTSLSPLHPPVAQHRGVGALLSGSVFAGCQRSGRSSYGVEVQLQHVNLDQSYLCGFLTITGLTEEQQQLTTFFDAEIVGPEHSFLTRKWDANEKIDRQHWNKFAAFAPYSRHFNDDAFRFPLDQATHVFMRWKEHFLVPDHQVKQIAGASFAGFYYICFNKAEGTIEGYYYHQNSEWFQSLHLRHVPQRTFAEYDFR